MFLKETKFDSIADHCEKLRMVKSPEELALWRRAYRVFDETHAFARDLLLAKGTDLTDYELAMAAQEFGMGRLMAGIKRDGKPHTAVGIVMEIDVRCGVGTAYPHPNQQHYNKIQKGQALQIAGGVEIGGCGGELYRAYLLAPWTDHQKKVWTVSRDCCLMQKDLSREGVACSTVAYQIHKHQVKEGMQKYIYHRPAHGMGMEGHQPPYLALGDYTMLEPGMIFSVEPGLYDPENGFGVNFSDGFAVQARRQALAPDVAAAVVRGVVPGEALARFFTAASTRPRAKRRIERRLVVDVPAGEDRDELELGHDDQKLPAVPPRGVGVVARAFGHHPPLVAVAVGLPRWSRYSASSTPSPSPPAGCAFPPRRRPSGTGSRSSRGRAA